MHRFHSTVPPNRPPSRTRAPARAGQAMVEFLVCLVAMIVLFAALVQIAGLGTAQTDTMIAARRQAGVRAILGAGPANADYIHSWFAGDDDSRHSRDDFATAANANAFHGNILTRAVAAPDDWAVLNAVPHNAVSDLRGASNPSTRFGLVVGRDRRRVELLPAVRHLLYDAASIEIESVVWMTRTGEFF